uniref:Uncharacterized protein n=1 Tax=Rhizophagus irregularis (strain DAOM 181602 / DAOM 197198 / MUCL 43194) TaxID=747089 RepID=U9SRP7_RHIID
MSEFFWNENVMREKIPIGPRTSKEQSENGITVSLSYFVKIKNFKMAFFIFTKNETSILSILNEFIYCKVLAASQLNIGTTSLSLSITMLHHVYNPIWRDLSKIIHVFLIFIFGFVFVNIIFEIRENVFLFYMRGAWFSDSIGKKLAITLYNCIHPNPVTSHHYPHSTKRLK